MFDLIAACLQKSLMANKKRHESLERLLLATLPLGIKGPSALAHALHLGSEQIVTNWGSRGVSREGALKAQQRFGINAQWILSGAGVMVIDAPARGTPHGEKLNALSDDALEIGVYFDLLPDKQTKTRTYVAIMNLIFSVEHAAAPAGSAMQQPVPAASSKRKPL